MLKLKEIGNLLLLITVSISYVTFTLAPRDNVVDLQLERYVPVSDLKKRYNTNKAESQMMHSAMLANYASNRMSRIDDLTVSLTPEIQSIDAEELLQVKYLEQQQKEALKCLNSCDTKEIISEEDIKEPQLMSEKKLKNKVFDSDAVLREIYATDNIENVLKHPLVQARLDRFEKYFKHKRQKAWQTSKINKYNRALHVIEMLRSKEVEQLIKEIHNGDFATANKALRQLQDLFFVDGKYMHGNAYGIQLLKIDLLELLDEDFKTRADVILHKFGQESLNEIEHFSELCDVLQGKNDVIALANLYHRLEHKLAINVIRNEVDEICYAIVKRALDDPINSILGDIKYGSWDTACVALHNLEQQVGSIPSPRIMVDEKYFRKSLMHRSKFRRLATAHNLHRARPDYRSSAHIGDKTSAISYTKPTNLSEIQKESVGLPSLIEQKIEDNLVLLEKKGTLSIHHNDNLDALVTNYREKIHSMPQNNTLDRLMNRINAINQTRNNEGQCFDYSSRIDPFSSNGPNPKVFENMFGTELDCQLHQELSHIRNTVGHLEQRYPNSPHVKTLAPVIYDYTIQAKNEHCPSVAFELSDFCHTITEILENGMDVLYEASSAIGKGICKGAKDFATVAHWQGMVTGAVQLGLLFNDAVGQEDALHYAMVLSATSNHSDAVIVAAENYYLHNQSQKDAINHCVQETYTKIKEMPWQDVMEHGSEIGTTMILDMLAFNAIGHFGNKVGSLLAKELTSAMESGAIFTEQYALEIAGFGKLITQEGAEVSTIAAQAVETDYALFAKSTKPVSQQIKQNLPPLTDQKNIVQKIRPENLNVQKASGQGVSHQKNMAKQIDQTSTVSKDGKLAVSKSAHGGDKPLVQPAPDEIKPVMASPNSVLKPDVSLAIGENFSKLRDFEVSVENLAKQVSKTPVGKLLEKTPLHKIPDLDYKTELFYNSMRKTSLDIDAICKNTGVSREIINKIKDHVFLEEHILRDGVGRFFPDADMAAAWNRLIENRYVYSDLKMLQHEYAESLIMEGLKVAYDDAHYAANKLYDWDSTL